MRYAIFRGAPIVAFVLLCMGAGNLRAAEHADVASPQATPSKSVPPVQSGVYGFSGARIVDSPNLRGVVGECIWVYDVANKTQVAKGDCDRGEYRVPLKPGRYVVRGPGGNRSIEIKPGSWTKVDSIVVLPQGL
jgi:hypothetical protein